MSYNHSNIFHFPFGLPQFGKHDIYQYDNIYGPVKDFEDSQYRVCNLYVHPSNTLGTNGPLVNAISCFKGKIFAQYNELDDKINLVLKPFEQSNINFTPVKYIIYRGLDLESFVLSNPGVNSVHLLPEDPSNSELLTLIYSDWDNSGDAPVSVLGLDLRPGNFDDSEFLDKVFEIQNDNFQLPIIPAGLELGVFNTKMDHKWGIEIVLDEFGEYLQMLQVRKEDNIIDVGPLPNPPLPETIDVYSRREKIHRYLDIAAYLNMHYHADLEVRAKIGTDFSVLNGQSLYHVLTGYFETKNTFYIDIRNEHQHSLNYYDNYRAIGDSFAKIKYSLKDVRSKLQLSDPKNYLSSNVFMVDPPEEEYQTHKWPILILDLSNPSFSWDITKKKIYFDFRLPKSPNANDSIFNVGDYIDDDMDDDTVERLLTNTFQVLFSDDVNDSYYRTIRYMFRKLEFPSNNYLPIPTYIKIHFTKDVDIINRLNEDEFNPPPEEKYRVKQLHLLDGIFSPMSIYASWKTDWGTVPAPPPPAAGQYIIRWKFAAGERSFGWMRRKNVHATIMQGVANDAIGEVAFAVISNSEYNLPNDYKRHYPTHRGALQDLHMSGNRFLSESRTFYHAYHKIQDWFFDYSSFAERLFGNDELFQLYTPPAFVFENVDTEFSIPGATNTTTLTLKNPRSGPDDFVGFPTGNLMSIAITYDEKQTLINLISSNGFHTAMPIYYVASDFQVIDNDLDSARPVYRLVLGLRGLKFNAAVTDFEIDTIETSIVLYSYDGMTFMTEDYMFPI
jgi:hypothetical protein